MSKVVLVTGGAGFISAGRSSASSERSSDINFRSYSDVDILLQ